MNTPNDIVLINEHKYLLTLSMLYAAIIARK